MLFQPEHIKQIRSGEKTATRRDWKRRAAKPGNIYIASSEMFTSHEDADCYIRVSDVYEEPLGEMDEEDATKEGGYSLPEFRDVWREIHGKWTPEETIYVVEFEYAGRGRPQEASL